jgi:hypothetical protein
MSTSHNGFQAFVNTYQPLGQVGARASMNPRAFVLGGEAAYTADATDVVRVGNFAWLVPSTGVAHGALTANAIIGFVANELETVITDWLGDSTLIIPEGLIVPGYTHGDFWVNIPGAVTIGAAVYADSTNGAPTLSSAGYNVDTGYKTASAVAADATATTTAIAATTGVLTVSVVTGVIQVGAYGQYGDVVTGTGVPDNVFIVSQISGTPGGAGTYQTNYGGPAVSNFAATFQHPHLVKISRTY